MRVAQGGTRRGTAGGPGMRVAQGGTRGGTAGGPGMRVAQRWDPPRHGRGSGHARGSAVGPAAARPGVRACAWLSVGPAAAWPGVRACGSLNGKRRAWSWAWRTVYSSRSGDAAVRRIHARPWMTAAARTGRGHRRIAQDHDGRWVTTRRGRASPWSAAVDSGEAARGGAGGDARLGDRLSWACRGRSRRRAGTRRGRPLSGVPGRGRGAIRVARRPARAPPLATGRGCVQRTCPAGCPRS